LKAQNPRPINYATHSVECVSSHPPKPEPSVKSRRGVGSRTVGRSYGEESPAGGADDRARRRGGAHRLCRNRDADTVAAAGKLDSGIGNADGLLSTLDCAACAVDLLRPCRSAQDRGGLLGGRGWRRLDGGRARGLDGKGRGEAAGRAVGWVAAGDALVDSRDRRWAGALVGHRGVS